MLCQNYWTPCVLACSQPQASGAQNRRPTRAFLFQSSEEDFCVRRVVAAAGETIFQQRWREEVGGRFSSPLFSAQQGLWSPAALFALLKGTFYPCHFAGLFLAGPGAQVKQELLQTWLTVLAMTRCCCWRLLNAPWMIQSPKKGLPKSSCIVSSPVQLKDKCNTNKIELQPLKQKNRN